MNLAAVGRSSKTMTLGRGRPGVTLCVCVDRMLCGREWDACRCFCARRWMMSCCVAVVVVGLCTTASPPCVAMIDRLLCDENLCDKRRCNRTNFRVVLEVCQVEHWDRNTCFCEWNVFLLTRHLIVWGGVEACLATSRFLLRFFRAKNSVRIEFNWDMLLSL